jgi:hypothetical protein
MQFPKKNSFANVESILVKKVRFYAYPHQPPQATAVHTYAVHAYAGHT